MSRCIPEFAFPTERFLLSGFGENAVYLKPTIICRYKNKSYLAYESLYEFSKLITSATQAERKIITESLADLEIIKCNNLDVVIDIDILERMRLAKISLINRYLDHLKDITP